MSTNITISIRDDLHRRTRVKAAEYNVSLSTFVASILEVYFQKSDARAKRLGTPPASGPAQAASAIPAPAPVHPTAPRQGTTTNPSAGCAKSGPFSASVACRRAPE